MPQIDSLASRGLISPAATDRLYQRIADISRQAGASPHLGPEMAPRGGPRTYTGASGEKVVAPDYGAEAAAAQSKTERFNWPVRTSYGKVLDMPVSVNPSRSMIQRELAQAPHGDVRALRHPNGDVYMWPANEAMHVDIANSFDMPFKTRGDLQKNSYLFNKADVDKLGKFSNFDDLVGKLGNLDNAE